jgi:hypothetical protein
MRRAISILLCGVVAFGALAGTATAKPKKKKKPQEYSFTAESTSIEYTKSVCDTGSHTVTETVTIENRTSSSGRGKVAKDEYSSAKGFVSGTASRTIRYTKTVQGPDAAPPEDGQVSEPMGAVNSDSSPFFKQPGVGVTLSLSMLGDNGFPYYVVPKLGKGQSATISLDADMPTEQGDDGKCTYEQHTTRTGSITFTRVK